MIYNINIEVANCNSLGCHYFNPADEDPYICAHLTDDDTCSNSYSLIAIMADQIDELIYQINNRKYTTELLEGDMEC